MGSARPEHHLPERGLGARWSARPRAAEWPEPSAERMSGGTSAVSSCGTVTPPVRSFVRAIPPTAGPGDDRTREATYARHRPRRSSRRWTCGGGDRRRAERGRFGEHDRSAPARDGVPDYEPDPSRACRPPADAREDLPRRRARASSSSPTRVAPPPACRFHPRCPYATEICRTVEPPLVDYGNGHLPACHHPLNVADHPAKAAA
jgi:oligopeptide/dipeptide ABC transporter ATP-binding protein